MAKGTEAIPCPWFLKVILSNGDRVETEGAPF